MVLDEQIAAAHAQTHAHTHSHINRYYKLPVEYTTNNNCSSSIWRYNMKNNINIITTIIIKCCVWCPICQTGGEKNESGWRIQKKDALHWLSIWLWRVWRRRIKSQFRKRNSKRTSYTFEYVHVSVAMHVCVSVCYHYKHSIY